MITIVIIINRKGINSNEQYLIGFCKRNCKDSN